MNRISKKRSKYTPSALVFIALALYFISIFIESPFLIVSGVFYWLSLIFLFKKINKKSKVQSVIIFILSVPGLIVGFINGNQDLITNLLTNNVGIISLVIFVAFLNLRKPSSTGDYELKGKKGFYSTYFYVHFIGSVINFASVTIFGDKMSRNSKISNEQGVLLSRSFASAGFWSPFFVTVAVAETYNPEYEYLKIFLSGALMAILSFCFSFIVFILSKKTSNFNGVKPAIETLKPPVFICLIVILIQFFYNEAKTINIVIIVSLFYGASFFIGNKKSFSKHFIERFPSHYNEISLFLFSGLLGASILCLFDEFNLSNLSYSISPILCISFMSFSLLLACIGVHPVISITIFYTILKNPGDSANLLAFTMISTWVIGSSLSSFSGQNIGISSRYGINSIVLMENNICHSIFMLVACSLAIFLLF